MQTPETHKNNDHSWRNDRVFWIILDIPFLLGLIYNFVMLPGFGPDEHRHFNYVKLLVTERRLPFLLPNGTEYHGAHTLHPPLYYLFLIPFYLVGRFLPGDAVWHVMRLGSLALCLASLVFIYVIAQKASSERSVARFTVALVGLLPIFGMTCGTINNDSSSIFAVAFFLWLLIVKFVDDDSPRAAVLIGLCLGLGMLCKATVALCDGAAILAYFLWRKDFRSSSAWRALMITLVAGAIVASPWYIRNFLLYGKFSPIENGFTNPALPAPSYGVLIMMMHPNFPPLFAYANWGIFYSLWSQKDWIPQNLRNPIYISLAVICLIGLIGHARRWTQKYFHKEPADNTGRVARVACYSTFVLVWLACLWMAMFVHWGWAEGGRYLVASLVGLAVFVAYGWYCLLGSARLRLAIGIWCVLAVALNSLTIYWLLAFLNPTYGNH